MTYVSSGVVVSGFAAHVIDRCLARYLPTVLPAFPSDMRAEVLRVRDDVHRASEAYLARPTSADGTTEPADAELAPPWTDDIDTETAAQILGVSTRYVRQLAARGLGRKVGAVWVLDRTLVYAERRHRSEEA